ncbi:MAG: hypothetical protein EBX60_11300 [Betaproteobacteria bacterium]|nr:hypothetical protein [Betaproteobacteria bacterium]
MDGLAVVIVLSQKLMLQLPTYLMVGLIAFLLGWIFLILLIISERSCPVVDRLKSLFSTMVNRSGKNLQ